MSLIFHIILTINYKYFIIAGTLDPSAPESTGKKPKRDINTILQILNDLLMASPQFRQYAQYSAHPFYNPSMHGISQDPSSIGKTIILVEDSENSVSSIRITARLDSTYL